MTTLRPTAAGLAAGVPRIEPDTRPTIDATILICTYNRASYLAAALDSIGRTAAAPGFSWDVLVVDNNSSDDTREVVESRRARYPATLRYLFDLDRNCRER